MISGEIQSLVVSSVRTRETGLKKIGNEPNGTSAQEIEEFLNEQDPEALLKLCQELSKEDHEILCVLRNGPPEE